ncbi:uncharacterized protein PG998_006951 [Apiospora kogelbergensis]|uniref:uncharacterized protein n=1 Tax=Apiospora kogelbergensis TaxID=1337665 RepID=UPI00313174C4
MASPQLAIAKVSFSAILLRQDPISCPRSEIDAFFSLLDATLSRCSPVNVQQSKQWMLKYVVASPARVAALGKYLMALSKSFTADVATSRAARETSSRRKRLHVLYVLSDIIHHVTIRQRQDDFASGLEPFIPGLVEAAAGYSNSPNQMKKVLELITLWSERDYFMPSFISQLESVAKEAPTSQASATNAGGNSYGTTTKLAKEAPFIMPSMHGDPSVPWYDLPAANWLPVIEPNSSRPMNPSMIKPLQLAPGPADKALARAVQDLLDSVDKIYGEDTQLGEDHPEDIDQLGQRIVVDEITRDVLDGETYYGWSRNFCDKMKKRRNRPQNGSSEDNRGRSQSRSQSRSITEAGVPIDAEATAENDALVVHTAIRGRLHHAAPRDLRRRNEGPAAYPLGLLSMMLPITVAFQGICHTRYHHSRILLSPTSLPLFPYRRRRRLTGLARGLPRHLCHQQWVVVLVLLLGPGFKVLRLGKTRHHHLRLQWARIRIQIMVAAFSMAVVTEAIEVEEVVGEVVGETGEGLLCTAAPDSEI